MATHKQRKTGRRRQTSKRKKAEDPRFTTQDGKAYQIPVEGSLGLLATGYTGIMAWRKVRKEALEKKRTSS